MQTKQDFFYKCLPNKSLSSEVGLGHKESEEQSFASDEENEVLNLFERFAEVTHVNSAMTVQDF